MAHYAMSTRSASSGASDKQLAFIKKLIADRDAESVKEIRLVLNTAAKPENGGVNKALASAMINALLQIPSKETQSAKAAADKMGDGYYWRVEGADEIVYEIVTSKAGNKYVKRLVQTYGGTFKWEYARGAIYHLDNLTPLTLEKAQTLGVIGRGAVLQTKLPAAVKQTPKRTAAKKAAPAKATKAVKKTASGRRVGDLRGI
jgi:murein DD-endopeptidase MepM/ murein hydrolase activator NlpD